MFLAMSAINLDKIFHPKSIAVIGDDPSNGTIYSILVQNLMNGGYPGKVYRVIKKNGISLPVLLYWRLIQRLILLFWLSL